MQDFVEPVNGLIFIFCDDFSILRHCAIYILGERWQFVKAPSTWEDSGSTSTKMGVTGYIFSGGTTYDHRSGDQDDAPLAIYWEGDSLDPYYGHSDQDSQYHYHAVSFT